ncbi:MAG TPA: sigma-70 family RNA polymerase sigma factor [Steroidobacteraceae bacterium]
MKASEPAFAALVRRYQRTVYSIALRMLSDRHRAEDLAQEVFLQLYRSLDDIGSDAHLAFWLRKVTVNRAIDRIRQEARYDNEPLSEAAAVAEDVVDADPLLQRHLAELVAQLPPAARAVVVLRYQEDLDPVDIASTLDMPINTVKSHLKRSLTSLRARVVGAALVDDVQPSMSEPTR